MKSALNVNEKVFKTTTHQENAHEQNFIGLAQRDWHINFWDTPGAGFANKRRQCLIPMTRVNTPTHIRWSILASVVMVTVLTYLDRLNLGIAGKYIQDELSFSTHTMGWVLSAFLLGYSPFQVPGGWVGDRFGPKRVLTIAILLWSIFTALTALAPSLSMTRWLGAAGTFMIVRFLVGVGEAAAAPACNKLVANWIGSDQHGMGSSAFVMGIGIGGAFTRSEE